MIAAIERKPHEYLKVDRDNEVLRELINVGDARPFQGKEMFWVEPITGEHSQNIDDVKAAEAITFFAAQEEEEA